MHGGHLDDERKEIIDDRVEGLVDEDPPGHVCDGLEAVIDEELRGHHDEPKGIDEAD